MSKNWQLPRTHESGMNKSFSLALSHIHDFEEGKFKPPAELVASVEDYLCGKNNAKDTLNIFTNQLIGINEELDASDNPVVQATLAIAIVMAWASSKTESKYPAFWALVQNSWWLENLWTDVALIVARLDDEFKESLLNLAKQHFYDAEKKLLEEQSGASNNEISLDDIWHGHSQENRLDDSSWPWIELQIKLSPDDFFGWINSTESLLLINRVISSPEFHRNYDLWEQLTRRAPVSFESDGSWNNALLLPSLLSYGNASILHIANSYHHSAHEREVHVKSLLKSFVETVAERPDFEGLFKRWGTWLTRQHLAFPENTSDREISLNSQDILGELSKKIPKSFSPAFHQGSDLSWEPWVYQSMLALLHMKYSEKFNAPDVIAFVNEWRLSPAEWSGKRGRALRAHASQYRSNEPSTYACRILGYSIALNNDFSDHWLEMWESSFVLREILEFCPVNRISEEWRPYEASALMCTLVDVGLGILDCTANDEENINPEVLEKSAKLFQALWDATTEMLSIDIYGEDFWPIMQQHLVIRRIKWAAEAKNKNNENYSTLLDRLAFPTSLETLVSVSSNSCSLIRMLPLLMQNSVSKQVLCELINQAQIDLKFLALDAAKYQSAPERRFKIQAHHVKLINELIADR